MPHASTGSGRPVVFRLRVPDARGRCQHDGDGTRCNPEGPTYGIQWPPTTGSRTAGRVQIVCCNHAARFSHEHGLSFPPLQPISTN